MLEVFREAGHENLLHQPFPQELFRLLNTVMLSLPDGAALRQARCARAALSPPAAAYFGAGLLLQLKFCPLLLPDSLLMGRREDLDNFGARI